MTKHDKDQYLLISDCLTELSEAEEGISEEVEAQAQRVLVGLIIQNRVPPDKIWNHGPDSVVLDWSTGQALRPVLLTISKKFLALCQDTEKGVLHRCEQEIGDSSTADALEELIKKFVETERRFV